MKRFIVSFLITLIILFILFTQISLKDLFDLLINLDPLWGMLGSISYLLALFLRALRFKWLIHSSHLPFLELLRITVLYHFALMVLPSKLGELSYPYFLNRWGGMGITEGLASLIASRVYDFLIVLMIFIFIIVGFEGFLQRNLLLTIFFSVLLLFFVLIAFFYITNILTMGSFLIGKIGDWAGLKHRKMTQWIQRKIHQIAEDFYAIRARKTYYSVSLASLGSWVAIFFVFYALMRGFGIEVSFVKLLFASTIAIIANALPISGLGNWGTLEAGWAAGFLIVGLSKEEAISSGFGVHIVIFLVCGLTALFCWASLNSFKERKKKKGPPT